jgi:hypothetical protein
MLDGSVYFLVAFSGGSQHSPLELLVVSEPPFVLVVGGDGLWLSALELLLEPMELLEQIPPTLPGVFSSWVSRRLRLKSNLPFNMPCSYNNEYYFKN